MKRVLVILCLFILLITSIVYAENEENSDEINSEILEESTSEGETVTDNSDESISTENYEQNVDGDMFLINSENILEKNVNGNVYMLGENVTVKNSYIDGNLFVICSELNIENTVVNGSIYFISDKSNISCEANDIYMISNDISFNDFTQIWRSVNAISSNFSLNSSYIDGKLNLISDKLSIDSNSYIGGTVNMSVNEKNIDDDAVIVGEIKESNIELKENDNKIYIIIKEMISVSVLTVLVALALIYVFDRNKKMEKITNFSDGLKLFGKGLILTIALPVISVILIFSNLFVGIGCALIAVYFLFFYFSSSIMAFKIAQSLPIKNINNAKKVGISVLISLIIYALSYVSILGIIIEIIVVILGVGTIFNMIFSNNKEKIDEK